LKKDLNGPIAIVAIVLVAVLVIGGGAYFLFRPEPTLYKPELLHRKGGRQPNTMPQAKPNTMPQGTS